jgi:hypothetical protein
VRVSPPIDRSKTGLPIGVTLARGSRRFATARVRLFCQVFERVVDACIAAGLVGGEGFAVDASLIVADANKQRSVRGTRWNRAIDPQTASRATKEYLATLNEAAFGAASKVRPKFVSPSDPAAQWTGALRGPAFFGYADNYPIDVKVGIIMDVEATRAIRQAEVGAAKTMLERTEQRFAIKPERLAGDTAYGSGANLDWLVNEAKIAPHIPVNDHSKREDGTYCSGKLGQFDQPTTNTCTRYGTFPRMLGSLCISGYIHHNKVANQNIYT